MGLQERILLKITISLISLHFFLLLPLISLQVIPRKLHLQLQEFDRNIRHNPLILLGARGSGKTTAVQSLIKTSGAVRYLNLEQAADRALFNLNFPVADQLENLFFMNNESGESRNTLVILDEIQLLPEYSRHLSRLFQNAPNIRWIMTSSCQSTEMDHLISHPEFPVESMQVFPFSFHEFLMAIRDADALESYQEVPFPGYRHEKLLHYFHIYTLIGGMPAIIHQYAETGSISGLRSIYEEILSNLLQDIDLMKAVPNRKRMIRFVLQNIFPYAATRIKFNAFCNSPYKSREIGEVFRLLEARMILRLIYPDTSPAPPSDPDKKKLPRLQLLDTGMVNYFSGIQKTLLHSEDMNLIFHGQIARQVVGQELLATETKHAHDLRFWVRNKAQSGAEVDFLLPYQDFFIPVEVRSGEPGRLRSLHQFMDAAPHPFAVQLTAGKLSIRQTRSLKGTKFYLLCLPYFLAGKIKEHLEGFIKFIS